MITLPLRDKAQVKRAYILYCEIYPVPFKTITFNDRSQVTPAVFAHINPVLLRTFNIKIAEFLMATIQTVGTDDPREDPLNVAKIAPEKTPAFTFLIPSHPGRAAAAGATSRIRIPGFKCRMS